MGLTSKLRDDGDDNDEGRERGW